MVWISNSSADSANGPEPVPEGSYPVEVSDVVEKETRAGDPMWRLYLTISGGVHDGKTIYDNLVFSAKGMPKALAMLKAVGLEVSGGRDYQPIEIVGRRCQVTVYVKELEEDGLTRNVNQVPFSGYGPPVECVG